MDDIHHQTGVHSYFRHGTKVQTREKGAREKGAEKVPEKGEKGATRIVIAAGKKVRKKVRKRVPHEFLSQHI